MKRLIIDSKKMTPEILALVKEKYPEGYYEDDIIVFKNHKNETIEAIQVESEDAVYLIKIGKYLSVALENFEMELDVDPKLKPREIEEENTDDDDDVPHNDNDEEEEDDDDDDDDEDGDDTASVKGKSKKN